MPHPQWHKDLPRIHGNFHGAAFELCTERGTLFLDGGWELVTIPGPGAVPPVPAITSSDPNATLFARMAELMADGKSPTDAAAIAADEQAEKVTAGDVANFPKLNGHPPWGWPFPEMLQHCVDLGLKRPKNGDQAKKLLLEHYGQT